MRLLGKLRLCAAALRQDGIDTMTHIPSQNSHSIFTATVEEKFIALKNVDYIIYFVKLKIIRMENANEKKNIVSAGNCQIVDIQRLIQSSSAKVKVENSYFHPRPLLIPEPG